MSRKQVEAKPGAEDTAHPLPQSGGSFVVTAGQLVLEEYAQNQTATPEKTPDQPAVKPVSKEA